LDKKLPIFEYREKIKEVVKTHPRCIIVGETGSGKTTQIPLMIREILQPKEKIAITQPRRVAVRSVTRYVAERVGSPIGGEVGYQIRFEDRTTEGTRINFMTDGILLRKLQEDPLLRDYAVVMVDEAHERSLNIDFVLGLLKKAQKERKERNWPSLKVIVASATIEKEKFAQYFENAPIIEIPGRLYPVEVHYEEEFVSDYCEKVAEKVEKILKDPKRKEGDILIFMPGQEEIERTIKEIEARNLENTVCLPLCKIVSFFGLRSVFVRPKGKEIEADLAHQKFKVPGSDFLTLLKVWENYQQTGYSNKWAQENFLHWRTLKEAREIQFQLLRILGHNGIEIEKTKNPELIGKSIAAGLIGNLMSYYSHYRYLRIRDGEVGFYIHPSSALFGQTPKFLVAGEVVRTKKTYLRMCQEVKPEWLKEIAPHWIEKKTRDLYYDFEKDKVIRKAEYYLKNVSGSVWEELEEVKGEEAVEVFAEILAEKSLDFPFIEHNEKVLQTLKKLWIRSEGKM